MRILFTGASSVIGGHVLKRVLDSVRDVEVWCVRHERDVAGLDSRVRIIDLNLATDLDSDLLPDAIDLVIHFAGVTHARDPGRYWEVNFHGTRRLAEAARARGCRRFVYISTRCATPGAGAYGESKRAAENELQKLRWDTLLIFRPSEVYGAGGKEGIDKLIALAQRWYLTPLLFGNSKIRYAPLYIDDFAVIVADEILKGTDGLKIIELCGPEDLTTVALAGRISKRYKALPVPIWWPLFAVCLKMAVKLGFNLAVPDQLDRLTCVKTATAETADKTGRVSFLHER